MIESEPRLRDIVRAALPACLLVVLCLSFFAGKAFTIDDTIFLRAADQATKTPLHPYAFDMCWDSDGKVKRFSQFVANAPLMGYVLVPAVLSGAPEVEGHALQLLLLAAGILLTASLALRLGLSTREARWAATLTATCPVVLGMAATVMPDVLAMTLGVMAIDRFLAWRQGGSRWSAGLACLALVLAPLARPQMALMLPVCMLLCFPRVTRSALILEWRQSLPGLVPIAIAAGLYFTIAMVTRDPASRAVVIRQGLLELSPHAVFRRAVSLGCNLALTTPFVAGALLLLWRQRGWRAGAILLMAAPFAVLAVTGNSRRTVNAVSALACLTLIWVLGQLWKRRSGTALALALWTLFPFPMIFYLHMATKFLVPSVPAYALILVILARESGPVNVWIWRALPAAGLALGLLIVSADTRAANLARAAVQTWVPQLTARGHRVWFLGQWGFQWYAELDGARCFAPASPVPVQPGDFVVLDMMSNLDRPFPARLYPEARRVGVISEAGSGGLVTDSRHGVGFYSDGFGPLPWGWEPAGSLRFELWKL